MNLEQSSLSLGDLMGQRIHIIAYGASYLGVLREINFDQDYIILNCNGQNVTLFLEYIDSFDEAPE